MKNNKIKTDINAAQKLLVFVSLILLTFSVSAQSNLPELIPYHKNGKWGFANRAKNIVIPCEYDDVGFFNKGVAIVASNCSHHRFFYEKEIVANKACKKGVIDTKGNLIFPMEFDHIENFNDEGIAKAFRNDKVGFIDNQGREIFPFVYSTEGFIINKNLLEIFLDGKTGLLNLNSLKIEVPVKYDTIVPPYRIDNHRKFSVIRIGKNGKWGFYNPQNGILVEPQFDQFVESSTPFRGGTLRETENYLYTTSSDKLTAWDKRTGKIIISGKYDQILPFKIEKSIRNPNSGLIEQKFEESDLIQLRIGDKWGVANHKGKIIIPIKYDHFLLIDNYIQAEKDQKTLFFNLSGKKIRKNFDRSEKLILPNLTKFQRNNKWGILDADNHEIIPPDYDKLIYQQTVDAILAIKDKKYGLFTTQGEEIAACEYDAFDPYSTYFKTHHSFVVQKNGRKGLVNFKLRKEVVPCEYEEIGHFFTGTDRTLFKLRKDGNVGAVDHTGKMMIPPIYKTVKEVASQGYFVVTDYYDKTGIMNLKGEVLIPLEYQSVYTDYSNPFILKKNDKWGLLDSITKQPLTDFKFDFIKVNDFDENQMARTQIHHFDKDQKEKTIKLGVISQQGKEIIPAEYEAIEFVQDLIFVQKNNKWGIFNREGKPIQNFIFDSFDNYIFRRLNRKAIAVEQNGKWGMINQSGEIILKPKYQFYKNNAGKYIIASVSDKWGVIDTAENLIISFQYDSVKQINTHFFAVQSNNLWGLRDFQNNEILPDKYENIEQADITYKEFAQDQTNPQNYFKFQQNGKWGLLNQNGKEETISTLYDEICVLSDHLFVGLLRNQHYIFYNREGKQIATINLNRNRYHNGEDTCLSAYFRKTTLLKTDSGYIDLNGNTYFE